MLSPTLTARGLPPSATAMDVDELWSTTVTDCCQTVEIKIVYSSVLSDFSIEELEHISY